MTYEIAQRARRRTRRVLLLGALSGAMALSLTALLLFGLGGSDSANGDVAGVRPGPTPGSSGSPGTSDTTSPQGDVSLVDFNGLELPVSTTAGPFIRRGPTALGFERSPRGAAFAALNIFARVDPKVGYTSFYFPLVSQVTGEHAADLRNAVIDAYQASVDESGDTGGAPEGGSSSGYPGYRVDNYSPTSATVHLLVETPGTGGVTFQDIALVVRWKTDVAWSDNGDWLLLAPEGGDWVASFGSPEPGTYTPFDERLRGA